MIKSFWQASGSPRGDDVKTVGGRPHVDGRFGERERGAAAIQAAARGPRRRRRPDRFWEKSCRFPLRRRWALLRPRSRLRARAARERPAANAGIFRRCRTPPRCPRSSQSWVRLQRVPPEMRIFTPGLRFFSNSSVRRPSSASRDRRQQAGRSGTDDDGLIIERRETGRRPRPSLTSSNCRGESDLFAVCRAESQARTLSPPAVLRPRSAALRRHRPRLRRLPPG